MNVRDFDEARHFADENRERCVEHQAAYCTHEGDAREQLRLRNRPTVNRGSA